MVKKLDIYDRIRIANRAVRKAQEANRRAGLPNVYARNGRLYYELPDGTITQENPLEKDDRKEKTGRS